ncbi:Perilipin-4 [Manis javanica]|nr:Perilipin-4 [Manis javanica]
MPASARPRPSMAAGVQGRCCGQVRAGVCLHRQRAGRRMGTPLRSFVLYDGLGALIWVGSAVYLGSLFSSTVEDLLGVLTALGQWGLLLLGVALGLFIVRKWWQRHRMVRSLRMPRMSVRELAGLHAQGMEPTVIDVRALPQYRQGHIPGAQSWELRPRDGGESHAHLLPQHDHPHGLVIYCDCPNEFPPPAWRASCSAPALPTCVRWWRPQGPGRRLASTWKPRRCP